MSKKIQNMYDKLGNTILPISSTSAIFDSKGNRLDRILDSYGMSLDDFEDYEPKEDNTKVLPPSLYISLKNIKSGAGVNNILSNVKASLLSMNDNINELGNIVESKNKTITFYNKKELDDWLYRRKSILNKGDLLLTISDKDYWWNGEDIVPLTANIDQSQIDKWDSILQESKEYTDNLFSNLINIDIKIVDKLPSDLSTNTLYVVKEEDGYVQYMYINSSLIELGKSTLGLSNVYTKEEIDSKLESIDINITGKEYQNLSISISEQGWYRIAKFEGYTNILKYGSFANGCNIGIRKRQVTSRSEIYDIDYISTNSNKQFVLNNKSTSSDQDITYIRNIYNTKDNISYIDFYYNGTTGNDIYIELNNINSEFSKYKYQWEMFKEVELADEIDSTNIEICKLDLSSTLDISSRISKTESNMKSLNSMLEQIIEAGTGDITISSGVSEEDLQKVKEETFEEMFPVGSFSFQEQSVGIWKHIISFNIKNDEDIEESLSIYKRIG